MSVSTANRPSVLATRPGILLRSDAAARSTIERMRRGIVRAIHDSDFIIWTRDRIRERGVDTRDSAQVANAVKEYVGGAIQYAPDPAGFDHIEPPTEHMKCLKQRPVILGDCDDAASLSAAMAGALGIPSIVEARAFWMPTAPFQHVVTILQPAKGRPVECDTTHDAQKLPLKVYRRLSVRVP